jgi:uncharacterized Rmd1/YagE family protein
MRTSKLGTKLKVLPSQPDTPSIPEEDEDEDDEDGETDEREGVEVRQALDLLILRRLIDGLV